jgi:microcystin-dependent protein
MSVTFVDGTTPLNAANLNTLESKSNKGQASGYAGLDATGKVPAAQLPASTPGFTMPSGVILPFAGGSAPTGFLFCQGQAVSRTTYANLFTAIGTSYGAGDGSTTFNLPDLQGRLPVGKGTNADVATLGGSDGVSLANRTPKHNHSNGLSLPNHGHGVGDPGHTHPFHMNSFGGSDPSNYLFASGSAAGVHGFNAGQSGHLAEATASGGTGISVGNPTSNPGIPGTIGPSGAPQDAPGYLVVNYVIST